MTLVINKIIDGNIYVHSDTRVSEFFDKKYLQNRPPLTGILRSIIITPKICISFAGEVGHLHGVLEQIFADQIFDLDTLTKLLLSFHLEKKQETDFSIATTMEGGQLIQIKDGKVQSGSPMVWLGDSGAFQYYQGHYVDGLNGLDNPDADDLSKLTSEAFSQTIQSEDEQTRSVGDFHMSIKTKDNEFRHEMKFRMDVGPQTINFEMPGEWTDIPFGSAANGSYGESYLVSETKGKPAIGIHFVHGEFGVLFYPMVSMNAILIKDVKWGDQFTAKVEEDYGVHLGGFVVVQQEEDRRIRQSFDAADVCAGQGDHVTAIKHYDEVLKIREVPEAFGNRGSSYMAMKLYDMAIADFARAIELGFENELIYRKKGICHGEKANIEKSHTEKRLAFECFKKCIELDANSVAGQILSQNPQ